MDEATFIGELQDCHDSATYSHDVPKKRFLESRLRGLADKYILSIPHA